MIPHRVTCVAVTCTMKSRGFAIPDPSAPWLALYGVTHEEEACSVLQSYSLEAGLEAPEPGWLVFACEIRSRSGLLAGECEDWQILTASAVVCTSASPPKS